MAAEEDRDLLKRGSSKRRTAAGLFRFDRSFGLRYTAGVDEAGRGSLAGPLVAAGVLLDLDNIGRSERLALARLDDSKKKSEEEREELFPAVIRAASCVSVAVRSVRFIDTRGLHVSNLDALAECMRGVAPAHGVACLVDGFRLHDLEITHTAVVDGDARSAAIAAASVIAKVTRDRYMRRIAATHPHWNFDGQRRLLDPRAPRRDPRARHLAAAPPELRVDRVHAARAGWRRSTKSGSSRRRCESEGVADVVDIDAPVAVSTRTPTTSKR